MIVIGHFDAHGVATASAIARATKSTVIARYPDTGPRKLADFIEENFGTLASEDKVVIVDIPVDVISPERFIDVINRLAEKTEVVVYDHHGTSKQYAEAIKATVKLFPDALTMAEEIAKDFSITDKKEKKLLYIGVVADRDPAILKVFSRPYVENELMPLANTLDILVRENTQDTADALAARGVQYIEECTCKLEYPPLRLVKKIKASQVGNILITEFVDAANDKELAQWLPKTIEELLKRTGADYAVVPGTYFDYKERKVGYSVRVIQYWLSQLPSVEEIKSIIGNRKYVGHEKYVSIITQDKNETIELANKIVNILAAQTRRETVLTH